MCHSQHQPAIAQLQWRCRGDCRVNAAMAGWRQAHRWHVDSDGCAGNWFAKTRSSSTHGCTHHAGRPQVGGIATLLPAPQVDSTTCGVQLRPIGFSTAPRPARSSSRQDCAHHAGRPQIGSSRQIDAAPSCHAARECDLRHIGVAAASDTTHRHAHTCCRFQAATHSCNKSAEPRRHAARERDLRHVRVAAAHGAPVFCVIVVFNSYKPMHTGGAPPPRCP